MKKVIAIVCAALLLLSMAACSSSAKKDKYVVGVCQLVPHEALDAATNGFCDALKEALGEENVEIKIEVAAGDSNTCAPIVNAFVADKVDLIMANATPALQAAAAATGVIDGVCRPAGVPVIAGEVGICSGCGIATLSISYYDLGYATGKMAAKVLTGEADISTMPVGYAEKVTPMYNAEICADLSLTPLDGYEPIA